MGIFKSDQEIVNHFKYAVELTRRFQSNLSRPELLPAGILNYHGMSGRMTRVLMNNLANFDDLRYAEVGTFTGSTLFSAMYGNKITALCCDNWTEFGGPIDTFKTNVSTYMQAAAGDQKLYVFESDFNALEFGTGEWKDVDFYLFDGPHDRDSQYNGITKAYPALSDRFILMVDDWNWEPPRDGTNDAIKDLGLIVLDKLEIQTGPEEYNQSGHIINRFQSSQWHNGIAIFACKKADAQP